MTAAPAMKELRLDRIFRITRRLDRQCIEAIISKLTADGFPEVSQSVLTLLPHIDEDGIRPVHLADRLMVSKQAVQQSLKPLETAGYIVLQADTTDKRGKRAVLTEQGRALALALHATKKKVQDELRQQIGKKAFKQLETTLDEMERSLSEGVVSDSGDDDDDDD